jgi:hypothetical protein
MILIITEENTHTMITYTDVLHIENEENFGLNIFLKPNKNISHKNSPYLCLSEEGNTEWNNPRYDINMVYVSAITNMDNEDESFDTKYKLLTDNGVVIQEGILQGFKEE